MTELGTGTDDGWLGCDKSVCSSSRICVRREFHGGEIKNDNSLIEITGQTNMAILVRSSTPFQGNAQIKGIATWQ